MATRLPSIAVATGNTRESTILEETGSPDFVYLIQECDDILLYKVIDKVDVDFCCDFSTNGQCDYHCDRIYSKEFGWFRCFSEETRNLLEAKSCIGCYLQEKKRKKTEIQLYGHYMDTDSRSYFTEVKIGRKTFKENTFALIYPESVNLPDILSKQSELSENNEQTYDESLYPERYRKRFTEFTKGSLNDANKTYSIVKIKKIFRNIFDTDDDCQLEVQLLYRPHNCLETFDLLLEVPLDEVYLTKDERVINCTALREPCKVYYLNNPQSRPDHKLLPNRYFMTYCFNHYTKKFTQIEPNDTLEFPPSESSSNTHSPLKTLDLFSGCGGLAAGFKESRVSETLWAIEKEPSAAKSFSFNFPSAIVYNEDANHMLKRLLEGEQFTSSNQPLPQKGEVEMILGGPPCQGFSGMNRFSNRLYSVFKNSLLVTFLSYVDYYRPKVVIFENVRNFVQFEKCKILKLTLSCLLTMNYQVNYGILQAGSFGVPQSRRRTFIIATDQTIKLPKLPKPLHCFSNRACQLDIVIGNKRSKSIYHANKYGYFRSYTVADAINDLPDTVGYALDYACSYGPVKTFYQKLMRANDFDDGQVGLHVVPAMSLLNQTRIERIPCIPGADWRDLPNIKLTLSDGTVVEKLEYLYDDVKNGKSSNGSLRGVCSCASGETCSKQISRPENTLIPWGLVHTANRNYQWSGLFGRLQWDGFFITTITKTVPSSKQGSVLHPSANRVLSIRESARSQGFPDKYHFFGSMAEIKVQIGNAVPIPLARTIGLQVLKSLSNHNTNPGL
ncbi:DNA (cytosine-5)-methyltransferase 1-like [Tetranychus urticae]|uniref:DNA (cytosine-5)-methyltransferase 1-like n=1 Tax=Tetranychus urticae TaxID=32264 RepID=UPI000D644C38|nr:DNA (cytosine-5)-methyltransferase 1-like [Tetranychus urticae]